MTKTQIQRFTRICEDQGIRVTKTKKGLLLRFPDGSSTVQHFTNSDVRAEPNQIARFRRAGMTHPNDTRRQKDDLPSYITSGTITPKTRQKIIDYVVSQGFPESVLSSEVVRDLNMDPGWANRALYHTGFRPGKAKSRKVGRPWYTPDEILCLKEDPKVVEPAEVKSMPIYEEPLYGEQITVDDVIEAADIAKDEDFTATPPKSLPSAEQFEETVERDQAEAAFKAGVEGAREYGRNLGKAMKEAGMAPSTQEQAVESIIDHDLQYIDTRDSWTVDMQELLGDHLSRMVQDRLGVLRAVGIEYEIRVWRTTKS